MKNIVIFASGRGSNAEKIIRHLSKHEYISVSGIVSNKKGAGVLNLAKAHSIESHVVSRESYKEGAALLTWLEKKETDLIVLAGFLWLIPEFLIKAYPKKIINIHPSLLPNYGGKGMYGHHVHEAVFQNKETCSGITIHYVNEKFDEGAHIFQEHCDISKAKSPQEIAALILALEHYHFPRVIEDLLS